MPKFNNQDTVFVPLVQIDNMENSNYAICSATVENVRDRTVELRITGQPDLVSISSSKVLHRNTGILILRIGDMQTEETLLKPLEKSILQFCRLLMPDDHIKQFDTRHPDELRSFWEQNQQAYSHIIFVAHGTRSGLIFNDQEVGTDELRSIFDIKNGSSKVFISLACNTGYQKVAGELSKMEICNHLIAPAGSVHGAAASQFTQTFLSYHFLEGQTIKVAFRNARKCSSRSTNFRYWRNGGFVAGKPK